MRSTAVVLLLMLALGSACADGEGLPQDDVSPTLSEEQLPEPIGSESESGSPGPWFADAHPPDPGDSSWLAVWFAAPDMPTELHRFWRRSAGPPASAEEAARVAIEWTVDPPSEVDSAFTGGLTIRSVSVRDDEVLLDLDAASPGLAGHGSHGATMGKGQLVAIVRHYFPEAHTLCVMYDGVRTDVERGGPAFLHDMSGCPIPLAE